MKVPPATDLNRRQYDGYACAFCGVSLVEGAVPAGRATGWIGAYDMSVDVYACRPCAALSGLLVES